jgi:hypothetical protein
MALAEAAGLISQPNQPNHITALAALAWVNGSNRHKSGQGKPVRAPILGSPQKQPPDGNHQKLDNGADSGRGLMATANIKVADGCHFGPSRNWGRTTTLNLDREANHGVGRHGDPRQARCQRLGQLWTAGKNSGVSRKCHARRISMSLVDGWSVVQSHRLNARAFKLDPRVRLSSADLVSLGRAPHLEHLSRSLTSGTAISSGFETSMLDCQPHAQ